MDRSGDLVHQNLYLLKQSRSNENDNYRTLSLARHTDSTQTQDTLAEIPANYSVLSGKYSVLSGKYSVLSGNYSVLNGNYSVLSGNTDPWQNIRDVNTKE